MVMTFVATVIAGASIAGALFGGLVSADILLDDALSVMLAGVTATAVAGAAALDG
jgi:hypothetical protein